MKNKINELQTVNQFQLEKNPAFFEKVISLFTFHFSLKCAAFTLAETLITLGIIGVVAALVLPSVISNAQDRQYEAGRKRILYNISEAVKILQTEDNFTSAANAEDFVENYLKKKLNIVKTCKKANLRSCGFETGAGQTKSLTNQNMTMGSYVF